MQPVEEADCRPIPPNFSFVVDDVVLAYHGSLLYEARVLDVEADEGQPAKAYLVHFQGWRKSWDEKVTAERVYEHNHVNLKVAHKLLNGAKMRQQALYPVNAEKEDPAKQVNAPPSAPPNALFQIPTPLQRQLVDDWEFVTKERKLVPLPRELSVQGVLHKWINGRRQSTDKATREVAEGLQAYFDVALPKLLLYKFERPQYNSIFHTGTPSDVTILPSAVYGAEHLLRLILKLPFLLDTTDVPKDTMETIAEKVNELAKYLQKNGRVLFLTEYQAADEEYLNSIAQT